MAEAAQDDRPTMAEIAARHFPRGYHGTVPEPAAEPAAEEAAVEALEEPAEAPVEAAEEPVEAPEESAVIESLSELIEAQEWDPEWVKSLRVATKVNGEDREATIDQLVRSHQTQEAATQILEQAKAERAQVREYEAAQKAQWENSLAVSAAVLQEQIQAIEAEAQSPDLEKLRADDPAEWSARVHDITARRQALTSKIQGLAANAQQVREAAEAKARQEQDELLVKEQAALLEQLPSWQDAEVAKAEQTQLVDYLIGRGFTQQEAMGASDHRLILLARDAMLYRQGQQSADVAKKKVARVPKVLKPGAPQTADQKTRTEQAALRRQVRKAKSAGAATDAALELMRSRRK